MPHVLRAVVAVLQRVVARHQAVLADPGQVAAVVFERRRRLVGADVVEALEVAFVRRHGGRVVLPAANGGGAQVSRCARRTKEAAASVLQRPGPGGAACIHMAPVCFKLEATRKRVEGSESTGFSTFLSARLH